MTAKDLKIAEIVRPKLVQDGMFLVGLDIVGDKLMEINVFSPGGLGSAQKFTKVNFCRYVIHALQRKVDYMASLPLQPDSQLPAEASDVDVVEGGA